MGGNGAPLASLRMRLPGDPLGGEAKNVLVSEGLALRVRVAGSPGRAEEGLREGCLDFLERKLR